jgi:hypothetical protein
MEPEGTECWESKVELVIVKIEKLSKMPKERNIAFLHHFSPQHITNSTSC